VDFRDRSDYERSVWRLVWGITGKKPPKVVKLPLASAIEQGAAHEAAAVVPAPAVAAPARPAAAAPREAALTRLLTDAFDGSASELQQWIRLSLGQDVHNSVRLEAPLGQLAFDTVIAVQQRGLADRAMFESLLAKRPSRGDQIRHVARLYGIVLAP
jgi:hypothetical protein